MWTKNYSYVASEHSAVVASDQCTMPPFESEICFSYTAIMTKLRGEVLVTCKNLIIKLFFAAAIWQSNINARIMITF